MSITLTKRRILNSDPHRYLKGCYWQTEFKVQSRTNGSLQEEKEFPFSNIFKGYDTVVYLDSTGLRGGWS